MNQDISFIDIIKYSYKSILQFGTIIGFFVLSFYFLSIGYFPISDLTSLISIYLFEAFLFVLFLGAIATTFFYASFFWFTYPLSTPSTCCWIVGRKDFENVCKAANNRNDTNLEISNYAKIRSFLIFIFFNTPYILATIYFLLNKQYYNLFALLIASLMIMKVSFLIFPSAKNNLDYCINIEKNKPASSSWNLKKNYKNVINTMLASTASGGSLILSLLFTDLLITPDEDYFFKIAFPLILLFSSGLSISLINNKQEFYKELLVFSLIIVLAQLQYNYGKLQSTIIRRASLGAFSATIEVNNIACNLIKKNHYFNEKIKCNKINTPIAVKKMWVLWRGNEYYLEFKDKNSKPHRVIIPSKHVYGISFDNNKNETA